MDKTPLSLSLTHCHFVPPIEERIEKSSGQKTWELITPLPLNEDGSSVAAVLRSNPEVHYIYVCIKVSSFSKFISRILYETLSTGYLIWELWVQLCILFRTNLEGGNKARRLMTSGMNSNSRSSSMYYPMIINLYELWYWNGERINVVFYCIHLWEVDQTVSTRQGLELVIPHWSLWRSFVVLLFREGWGHYICDSMIKFYIFISWSYTKIVDNLLDAESIN